MKLRTLAVLATAGTLALTACGGSGSDSTSNGEQTYSIGITQIVSHPSLDAAVTGFKAALEEAGIEATYDEQNAQGDQATAASIASKFASADLDLVLAVATPPPRPPPRRSATSRSCSPPSPTRSPLTSSTRWRPRAPT